MVKCPYGAVCVVSNYGTTKLWTLYSADFVLSSSLIFRLCLSLTCNVFCFASFLKPSSVRPHSALDFQPPAPEAILTMLTT